MRNNFQQILQPETEVCASKSANFSVKSQRDFFSYFQVRSLTNLSDFSLDVSNGNYDNYGGITDSLLSAEASKDLKQEGGSPGGTVGAPGGHGRHPTHHGGHHQTQQHNPGTHGSSGPLLDFKSAFSDLDTKPSDLR